MVKIFWKLVLKMSKIVQGIIQSQDPKTVLSQSSSSDSTSPAIFLGEDNEDDCFDILPPIKRHKKKVSTENVKNAFGAGVIHLRKVSRTFKRRHPLTKGVPHFYKRQTILLYIKRLHSTWRGRTGYNHTKFLCKRIILFLYTHKLHHFIPCFVFKTCINSKTVTHISCKLSPVL
jgi:hypothetical protein